MSPPVKNKSIGESIRKSNWLGFDRSRLLNGFKWIAFNDPKSAGGASPCGGESDIALIGVK
jgi:hypothetical protein